jgi:hypothetical protein
LSCIRVVDDLGEKLLGGDSKEPILCKNLPVLHVKYEQIIAA